MAYSNSDLDQFPALKALSDRLPPEILQGLLVDFQRMQALNSEIDAERRNFRQKHEKARQERDIFQTALIGLLNLGGEEEVGSFLQQALELVARLAGAEVAALSLLVDGPQELRTPQLITRHCTEADFAFIQEELLHARGLLRQARERGQIVMLPQGADSSPRLRDNLRQRHVRAAIILPFAFDGAGVARGVAYLEHMSRPEAFTGDLTLVHECLTYIASWVTRAERIDLRRRLSDHTTRYRTDDRYRHLIGRSEAFGNLLAQLELFRTTRSEAPILLEGETGTGRQTLAETLHQVSPRAAGPFIVVDCAASEAPGVDHLLFGDEHAVAYGLSPESARGALERARGGTVYLQNVERLPLDLQARLARALQDRRFARNHGEVYIRFDVRIISSAGSPLEAEVQAGRFRPDLAERLSLFSLRIPPLRERREDILPLAEAFLEQAGRELERPGLTLTASALQDLERRLWAGNLDELRESIHHATNICAGRLVDVNHLRDAVIVPAGDPAGVSVKSWKVEHDEFQRRLIRIAMDLSNRNVTQAAKKLNISRQYLNNRLRTLGMVDLRAGTDSVADSDDEDLDLDGGDELGEGM